MRMFCAQIVVGGCLLMAFAGCSFHRTAGGFILRGGCWTLERNREVHEPPQQTAMNEPESLPWRSRLHGYRLGARIFRNRGEGIVEDESPSPIAGDPGSSLFSTTSYTLECTDADVAIPEPPRPDLVVE